MAQGTTELKQQALATLQEGRREIRDEARWIRRELNFRRVAGRLTESHTLAVLGTAFAVGLFLPGIIFPRKKKYSARAGSSDAILNKGHKYQKPDGGTAKYLLGLVLIPGLKLVLRQGIRAALRYRGEAQPSHAAADLGGVAVAPLVTDNPVGA